MNQIHCDLFLPQSSNDKEFKYLSLFDKSFKYAEDKIYQGYLEICVERLKLIPLISHLNAKKIIVYSVPLEYKKNGNLEYDKAFAIASKTKNNDKFQVLKHAIRVVHTPLYWSFEVEVHGSNDEGLIPNNIYIDKIDGHIWTQFELNKYWYDFNNRF